MPSPVDKGKENRQTIINIVEKNQPIRSKKLYERAMKNNSMSNATVYKHLKKLVEENILKRRTTERHKEVYYELTEEGDVAIKQEEMVSKMIEWFKNIKDYEKQREFLEKLMDA